MKKRNLTAAKERDFTYQLPAIRALQAGKEYFTTAIPFCVLVKLLNDGNKQTDMAPLDRERPKAVAAFITNYPESYVLPALTVSIEGEYLFNASQPENSGVAAGTLVLPINTELQIHDGRYRALGIMQAIGERPSLGNDSVSVVIFPHSSKSERRFGEIKANQRKSGRSERIISDEADPIAKVTREVIANVAAFTDSIEMVKTTISNRSKNLFTFSSLYQANALLLANQRFQSSEEQSDHAIEFWKTIQNAMPDWTSETPRGDLRKTTVHAHGVTLCALARAGAAAVENFPKTWKRKLAKLNNINWSRSNTKLWEGKAMLGERMTKSAASVELTAKVISDHLGTE